MSEPQGLLGPDGQPARVAKGSRCPVCGASEDRRVVSAGFGAPHDVCSVCGHDFEELTR